MRTAFALGMVALVATTSGARTWTPAGRSPCDVPQRGPLVYHWPVKPFDRQHPIRGNFGDPRTVAGESGLGETAPLEPGSFTFHNGIDISAPTGTAVYPVVGGRAAVGYGDEVVVDTGDGRVFQYFHIRPAIRNGERVVAERTVLGHVLPGALHVHLSEIDGTHVQNPVQPGHLEPYRDTTVPVVHFVEASTPDGAPLPAEALHGRVRLAASASDTPPVPVPGHWFDLPVTPALVTWKLTRAGGRVAVRWRVAADFRHTEPPDSRFWDVYAPGTYQNFPVFGHRYFWGRPGRYLFELTPRPLDTRRLANGRYVLTVRAADVCGNRGTLRVPLRVANYPVLRSAAAMPAIDRRSGAAASSSPER
ncbi:MAG TPA: M23 family metallopeptidase [Gaiellaceae bacterium]|nr:M23 family metallopeptidase [Gaiellaceae bacterium]